MPVDNFSIDIQIKNDSARIGRLLGSQGARQVRLAANRALNRTISPMRSETIRSISRATGRQQKAIKPAIWMRRSNLARLSARVISQATTPNIIEDMSAADLKRAEKISRSGRYPVGGGGKRGKAEIRIREGGRVVIHPNAFLVPRRNKVYIRRGRGRFPIRQYFGRSIPLEMRRTRIANPIFDQAQERFFKVYHHEIRFRINKLLSRGR